MFAQTKHRFNVREYYRMAETGVLGSATRVELLNGEITDMSPVGSTHAGMVKRFIRLFTKFGKERYAIAPLAFPDAVVDVAELLKG
jgi:hypothetical protein